MKELRVTILTLLIAVFTASCETIPSATTSGPRSIVLGGETFSEADFGEFTSWRCGDRNDYYGYDTLVEVGSFSNSELEVLGFVLYDDSYSGELTMYGRKGLNLRWDWGDGGNYAFVIEPDGTGRFYDFSSAEVGESRKANEVYKFLQS